MAIGALRVPVRIAESYVRSGEEARLFPNFPEFLTLDEVLSIWPRGLITHEKFHCKGSLWRLVKRPMANGNSVYMAVLDDPSASGNSALPASCATPDTAQRLRSMPLDAFNAYHDGSDQVGSDYSGDHHGRMQPQNRGGSLSAHHSFHHAPSAPLVSLSSAQRELALQPFSGGSTGSASGAILNGSLRERNSSYSSMALVAAPPSGGVSFPMVASSFSLGHGGNGFMTDLLAATESPMPLDRYKAFVRLFSTLRRTREGMGLSPAGAAADDLDSAWESPEAQELVRQMVMVGECLAKFGTADFVDGRNNSARAITTKDYARLLRMYLEDNGAVFRDEFISRLPLALQDEALTVRTLLHTRCETNDLLFNQLVKHVGQEPAAGGAMVINNSTVSANPTNHMLAAPRTFVNTVSNAWSKADVKRRTQMGALGAAAVVALWVLKRKLFGGGGGGRGRSGGRDESEWGGSGGRRSSRIRGSGDLAARLLDDRSSAERMAVRYLSACHDELRRAARNDDLLRNDWRLGPIRLALPGSGTVPEGYEPVQTTYCSVGSYMNALDGGMPFVLPYGLTERNASPRESSTALAAASAATGE